MILLRRELQYLDKEIATYQTSAETQRLIAKCAHNSSGSLSCCPDRLQTSTCFTTTTSARISGSPSLETSAPCAGVSLVTYTPSLAWS